jgi:hypothetical protein
MNGLPGQRLRSGGRALYKFGGKDGQSKGFKQIRVQAPRKFKLPKYTLGVTMMDYTKLGNPILIAGRKEVCPTPARGWYQHQVDTTASPSSTLADTTSQYITPLSTSIVKTEAAKPKKHLNTESVYASLTPANATVNTTLPQTRSSPIYHTPQASSSLYGSSPFQDSTNRVSFGTKNETFEYDVESSEQEDPIRSSQGKPIVYYQGKKFFLNYDHTVTEMPETPTRVPSYLVRKTSTVLATRFSDGRVMGMTHVTQSASKTALRRRK